MTQQQQQQQQQEVTRSSSSHMKRNEVLTLRARPSGEDLDGCGPKPDQDQDLKLDHSLCSSSSGLWLCRRRDGERSALMDEAGIRLRLFHFLWSFSR
ncbi:hypothetical protein INR49_003255 [Caranx melampygus]|nr:hypothetical protein INR49_003255 [Caranx melampygus]